MTDGKKKIVVLLSTYNGEAYLEEQLQSILNQKLQSEKYVLKILARDDGSDDNTVSILEKYRKGGVLDYYIGNHVGCEKSFWDLIKKAGDASYYAFSDQDDVWFDDKISRAVERLLAEEEKKFEPLLYGSTAIPTDKNLIPLTNVKIIKEEKIHTDFPHSLLKNVIQGCTAVFNFEAWRYLCLYDIEKNPVEMHDWLAYKIISLFGSVIYDERPSMYYRQHDNNVVGTYKAASLYSRIFNFFTDHQQQRSEFAKSLEQVYKNELKGDNVNQVYLSKVAHYKEGISKTISLLSDKAYRVGTKDDIKFLCRVICRKV